jgi:alpha-D-xyloside xylohydrolase
MKWLSVESDRIIWKRNHETVLIEPWGPNSVRVRITRNRDWTAFPGALLPPAAVSVTTQASETEARLINGCLTVTLDDPGTIRFFRSGAPHPVFEEPVHPYTRLFTSRGDGLYRIEQRFRAYAGERLFGLGQHTDGFLNQKGCVVELDQRNTQVAIPFVVSSRNYGFLWNMPSIGQVELGCNRTRWIADAAPEIDYWFTLGESMGDVLRQYAGATGHPPMLPGFAAGFWQCKLRYQTQEELLSVAREYKNRGIPLSVIVIDFFHWSMMGHWDFDPKCWPDPEGMVRELRAMGVELMVSVWPTVNPDHPDYATLLEQGFLIRPARGEPGNICFTDTYAPGKVNLHYYDATHPGARAHVWSKLRENYYRRGIRVFWLDACEPQLQHRDYDLLRYHLGSGEAVSTLYPFLHAQGVYEGLRAEGEKEIIMLCRSAWAGSQRFGAAVWSGDISADIESLQRQIRAGLNMAMSGIPWWTTDIGGFHGGAHDDPLYRETLVRWFEYGAFCPLFRLHGCRPGGNGVMTGGPNEIWSFGEEVYAILREYILLRERLRPYIMAQMQAAHMTGIPPMRPLFVDSQDPNCLDIDDEFMFGPDLLVAPVAEVGARSRRVYLPAGVTWRNAWTGTSVAGGDWVEAAAPLNRIPLFLRGNAQLPILPP